MSVVLTEFLGLVIMSGGMALAYRKWISPLGSSLNFQQRGALLLVLLALCGGFIGSWFWWINEPRAFSWVLPPLASRMLASAGMSFFVVCIFAARRPTFQRVRLVMLLLFVYLVPLAAVIFLFHLDRFDPAALITYTFFAIAILMTVSSTWYLFLKPQRIIPDSQVDSVPPGQAVKTWLLVVAVLTVVWGGLLFATDNGPSSLIWVWPGDLLTSRLIGVMLLTIAAGAIYSRRRAEVAKPMLAMISTYGFGLAAASFWNLLVGKPIKIAYLLVFGIIFLFSIVLVLGDPSMKSKRSLESKIPAANKPVKSSS